MNNKYIIASHIIVAPLIILTLVYIYKVFKKDKPLGESQERGRYVCEMCRRLETSVNVVKAFWTVTLPPDKVPSPSFYCDSCWPSAQQFARTNYMHGVNLREHGYISLLSWFLHYIKDRTWEKISPDKDFELREALRKAEELVK